MKRSSIYRITAILDAFLAVVCARKGDAMCFILGLLAFFMWIFGAYWEGTENNGEDN